MYGDYHVRRKGIELGLQFRILKGLFREAHKQASQRCWGPKPEHAYLLVPNNVEQQCAKADFSKPQSGLMIPTSPLNFPCSFAADSPLRGQYV